MLCGKAGFAQTHTAVAIINWVGTRRWKIHFEVFIEHLFLPLYKLVDRLISVRVRLQQAARYGKFED
jgi:hypothetical protein